MVVVVQRVDIDTEAFVFAGRHAPCLSFLTTRRASSWPLSNRNVLASRVFVPIKLWSMFVRLFCKIPFLLCVLFAFDFCCWETCTLTREHCMMAYSRELMTIENYDILSENGLDHAPIYFIWILGQEEWSIYCENYIEYVERCCDILKWSKHLGILN